MIWKGQKPVLLLIVSAMDYADMAMTSAKCSSMIHAARMQSIRLKSMDRTVQNILEEDINYDSDNNVTQKLWSEIAIFMLTRCRV